MRAKQYFTKSIYVPEIHEIVYFLKLLKSYLSDRTYVQINEIFIRKQLSNSTYSQRNQNIIVHPYKIHKICFLTSRSRA